MANANRKSEEEGNTSRDAQIKESIFQEYWDSEIDDVRGNDAEEVGKNCISMCISLLDNREKHYEGSKYESILKDHVQSLKKGLEFLGKLFTFSTNRLLAESMRRLAADLKHHSHTVIEEENEDLGTITSILVEVFPYFLGSSKIFKKVDLTRHYRSIIDLLLENISEVKSTRYNNGYAIYGYWRATYLERDKSEKVRKLKMALTQFKPLCICLANSPHLVQMDTRLDYNINEAAVAIYLLFVGKMEKRIFILLNHVEDMAGIYEGFFNFRSVELTSVVERWLYILDNLIHILATNLDSLNGPSQHLYEALKDLRTFGGETKMQNRYWGITESAESIWYQGVAIVSTIYVEEDMHNKLDHIVDSFVYQIKMFKENDQEIRLRNYPRVDDLGFLEFFLERLDELHGQKKISVITDEIESLQMDFPSLVSSTKAFVQLAYQAEYVIDLCLAIPDPRCISTLSSIVEEVKEIKEKVLVLPDKSRHVKDVDSLTFKHVHGTTLHVNNELVGFKEEIIEIKNDLLTGESDLQVIYVVGMAGAGKTSLAKHLFKECTHDGHFDKKAWCTVSQTYQIKDLMLTILNQIDPSNVKDMGHQELADHLCRSLKRRRYLVVIDDVWDVDLWKHLSRYFPNDINKSRVLITTRDHNVASGTMFNIHTLQPLTEEESWELLQKTLARQESLPDGIERIAKEVAKSCKGLPLSISVIGGLLHHADRNEEMWNRIAKDVSSTILSDPTGECKAILELSYNSLPEGLKSCFLYLVAFPEDHEISVARLVRLWIAERLVRERKESDVCVEDVGIGYVDDLIKRNLIIPIKENTKGGVKTVQLHDLLHDFCLEKAKDEHFFTVLHDKGIYDLSLCPRRIRINGYMDEDKSSLSWNSVRTIISFGHVDEIKWILRSKNMLLLNVLDIGGLNGDEAAFYLHHCVHLRYLVVWNVMDGTSFFPKTLLLNLEVLILRCTAGGMIEVPELIWDLIKLRHIDILGSVSFRPPSMKIEDSTVLLENLKSLSKAKLNYGDSNWLTKLPKLQKLRCIISPSFDNSLQEDRLPELDLCNRLTSLNVQNGSNWSEIKAWCKLQLPARLRKLHLSRWRLIKDDLSGIGKSVPNLEVLQLQENLLDKWSVDDDDFPTLKVLKITCPPFNKWQYPSRLSFEEWDVSEEAFPKLEQLWLQKCHKLTEIPLCFGYIPNLRLISIKHCNRSLHESAREIQKIQAEAQNHQLQVHISD